MMSTTPDSYLSFNSFFLSNLGIWPYQKKYQKFFFLCGTCFFLTTQGVLQIGGSITAWSDKPVFLESLPPVLIDFVCLIKFFNFIYNSDKMKQLIDTLKNDWEEFKDEEEIKILENWARDSRKNTIKYAGAVYGSLFPLMLSPLIPIIARLIPEEWMHIDPDVKNAKPVMFRVEYFIDIDKYYVLLIINSYFGTYLYIMLVVAVDCMFMTYVQHACAVFNIVGYRLEKLADDVDQNIDINRSIDDDIVYRRMKNCIIVHSKAIQYAQLIESANSTSFLLQLGINMITLSFSGFQAATKLSEPGESFKYATFTCGQTFPLFFESWSGQRLVDESTRLVQYTIFSTWYKISLRGRKLLHLLIMKSMEPCQLTAGGFYILNLENFSSVVRTSMSYFTVLCSTTIQEE